MRAAAAGKPSTSSATGPETWDQRPNATLLIAESRIDGDALGSLRILASERGRLMVEDRVALPQSLRAVSVAEASCLAVKAGRNATLVRLMLWKAFHRYCLAAQVDTMLIAVRESALRQYEWLGFHDPQPAPVRFSGLSFSYNLAYAVFGGLTPPLIVSESQVGEIMDKVAKVIRAVA